MRHGVSFKQLSRTSSERKALVRAQVTSLLTYERIQTTLAKAKATQKMAEKVITRAKNANAEIIQLQQEGSKESLDKAKAINVHAHRMTSKYVYGEEVIAKLFNEVAPLFKEKQGGYTRILKIGNRANDSAEMAILELVSHTESNAKEKSDNKDNKNKSKKSSRKAKSAAVSSKPSKVKETKAVGTAKVTRQKKGGN